MKKTFWKNVALCAVGVAILAAVWIVAHVTVGNEYLVPDFFLCVKTAILLMGTAVFWSAVFSTLFRVLCAFVLSLIFAVIFAVIAYLYPTFRRIFAPIVGVLRALPVLGVLLIILVWTNSAAIAPVIVACLSLFPMLYAEILSALMHVDGDLIEMSKAYKVPLKRQIFVLYLPSALPHIVRSSGAALGFGVKLVISAEVLARTAKSLGNAMQDAHILSEMPVLFALLITACVLAFLLETVFSVLARLSERRNK